MKAHKTNTQVVAEGEKIRIVSENCAKNLGQSAADAALNAALLFELEKNGYITPGVQVPAMLKIANATFLVGVAEVGDGLVTIKASKGREYMIDLIREGFFLEECRDSKYVVRLLKGGGTNSKLGEVHILLEYLPLGDVHRLVERTRFPPESATVLAHHVLRGTLEVLHDKQNICHRDIKAANVLLDGTSLTFKIADFGISTRMMVAEFRSTMTGTGSQSEHVRSKIPTNAVPVRRTRGRMSKAEKAALDKIMKDLENEYENYNRRKLDLRSIGMMLLLVLYLLTPEMAAHIKNIIQNNLDPETKVFHLDDLDELRQTSPRGYEVARLALRLLRGDEKAEEVAREFLAAGIHPDIMRLHTKYVHFVIEIGCYNDYKVLAKYDRTVKNRVFELSDINDILEIPADEYSNAIATGAIISDYYDLTKLSKEQKEVLALFKNGPLNDPEPELASLLFLSPGMSIIAFLGRAKCLYAAPWLRRVYTASALKYELQDEQEFLEEVLSSQTKMKEIALEYKNEIGGVFPTARDVKTLIQCAKEMQATAPK